MAKKEEIPRSIYPRKNGSFEGYITVGEAENGKRAPRKYAQGKTEQEVKKKLNKIEFLLNTGQYKKPNKDTLVSFLYEYHGVCSTKWEATTASLYLMYIQTHIEPYFKDSKLTSIKAMSLDKFYNYKLTETRTIKIQTKKGENEKILPPLSINTVNKLNKFLKAAFNYAVVNDLLAKNPTTGIKLASTQKYIPKVYTEDQFKTLVTLVKGKEQEIPIVLAAGCGLRRGEICGLRWDNIDFENKILSVVRTTVRFTKNLDKDPKNETSKRKISIPGYVIRILEYHYKQNGMPKGKIITRWLPQSLSEMFNNLLDSCNMEHTRLHDLRHYNAVIMMQYGIPDKVAAERLGHSNVTTLRQVYQHVMNGMDNEAANMIDAAFEKIQPHEK